ncbi:MAG TPA: hypothetical protein VNT58_00415 [Gaiellaceae bacterium]|nr:hypothetical protein [Gaiellaceae bacterium]
MRRLLVLATALSFALAGCGGGGDDGAGGGATDTRPPEVEPLTTNAETSGSG